MDEDDEKIWKETIALRLMMGGDRNLFHWRHSERGILNAWPCAIKSFYPKNFHSIQDDVRWRLRQQQQQRERRKILSKRKWINYVSFILCVWVLNCILFCMKSPSLFSSFSSLSLSQSSFVCFSFNSVCVCLLRQKPPSNKRTWTTCHN